MVRPWVETIRKQYLIIQHQWSCKRTLSHFRETGKPLWKTENEWGRIQEQTQLFSKDTAQGPEKLYDLLDNLPEVESVKENLQYATLLSYYDSPSVVNPIINHCRTNGYQQSTKTTKYYSALIHHLVFLWILSMKSNPAFLNSIDLFYRLQVQRNEQQNISEQPDRCLFTFARQI